MVKEMKNLSSIKEFLRGTADRQPRLWAVYEFYISLLEIAYTATPDDLRPWIREYSDGDPTPMFNIHHLDPSLLPHVQETYVKVVNVVENQAPHGTGDSAFCLKWAFKPSFMKLLDSLLLKTEPTDRTYCPLCGGNPFMAMVPDDECRLLACGFCGYRWGYPAECCLSCGNREKAKRGFFVGEDGERSGYRAETCERCKTYLKTVNRVVGQVKRSGPDILSGVGTAGVPIAPFNAMGRDPTYSSTFEREDRSIPIDDMDVEDFATLPLDLLAQSRGYRNLPSVLVI
jgi:ribosomal protein S27AE